LRHSSSLLLAALAAIHLSTPRAAAAEDLGSVHAGSELGAGDPFAMPARRAQMNPALASDGAATFMAAWQDYLPNWVDHSSPMIRINRLDAATGEMLDPEGSLIHANLGLDAYPQIAYGGGMFLVAWLQLGAGHYNVWAARVAMDGTVLDPDGFAVSLTGDDYAPRVTFADGKFLVAWNHFVSGMPDESIRAAQVSQSGSVSAPVNLVSVTAGSVGADALVSDGTDALLLSTDSGALTVRRFDSEWTLLEAPVVVAPHSLSFFNAPTAAFRHGQYLIVWTEPGPWSGEFELRGARLDDSGRVLDPGGFSFGVTAEQPRYPQAAGTGDGFVVAWQLASGSAALARVAASGAITLLGSHPVRPSDQSYAALAAGAGNSVLAFTDERPMTGQNVLAARVTPAGELLDGPGIPLQRGFSSQGSPALSRAADGTYLAAFIDDRDEVSEYRGGVYAARIGAQGEVLDPHGIRIRIDPDLEFPPAVASVAGTWLVTWREFNHVERILAARIDASGTLLDQTPVVLDADADSPEPDVASDGTRFFVVWRSHDEVLGRFVSSSGAPAGPARRVALRHGSYEAMNTRVAFNGTHFLVVYGGVQAKKSDLYAVRVLPSGVVLDEQPVATDADAQEGWQAVASDGVDWMIVYRNLYHVVARRVSADGMVGPAIELGLCDGSLRPSISFDGTRYVVAWEAHGSTTGELELRGAWLAPSGERIAEGVIAAGPFAGHDSYDKGFALAPAAGGGTLAAYVRHDEHDVDRLALSFVTAEAAPPPGPPDAGPPDAGPPDAGAPPDAGPTPDADAPPPIDGAGGSGCGCEVARGKNPAPAGRLVALGLLVALALYGRRRRYF